MTLSITRKYGFSASHRLHIAGFSDAENSRLYGKCNNPFGHGHDYVLSVTAIGTADPSTGLLVNRGELDTLVTQQVLNQFRHRYINVDIPQFASLVPTTENVASVIAGLLREHWRLYISNSAARLSRVHIQETDRNGFEIVLSALRPQNNKEESNENVSVPA